MANSQGADFQRKLVMEWSSFQWPTNINIQNLEIFDGAAQKIKKGLTDSLQSSLSYMQKQIAEIQNATDPAKDEFETAREYQDRLQQVQAEKQKKVDLIVQEITFAQVDCTAKIQDIDNRLTALSIKKVSMILSVKFGDYDADAEFFPVSTGGMISKPIDPSSEKYLENGWHDFLTFQNSLRIAMPRAEAKVFKTSVAYKSSSIELGYEWLGSKNMMSLTSFSLKIPDLVGTPQLKADNPIVSYRWFKDDGTIMFKSVDLLNILTRFESKVFVLNNNKVIADFSFPGDDGNGVISQQIMPEFYKARNSLPRLIVQRSPEIQTAGNNGTDPCTVYWIFEMLPAYQVGDTGPAGGMIFCDKGETSDGWRYMEVAPSDQSDRLTWANVYNLRQLGTKGTSVGLGKTNTAAMVAGEYDSNSPAGICSKLNFGGYKDWFLPSIEELIMVYDTVGKSEIHFAKEEYWSSSEIDANFAWSKVSA